MRQFRVGLDIGGLATQKQWTGIQRYTIALAASLTKLAEQEQSFSLYLYSTSRLPAQSDLSAESMYLLRASSHVHWRIAPFVRAWRRVGMGAAVWADRLDVIHFPAPSMAYFCPVPSVVTFHDLAAMSLNGNITAKEAEYLPEALDAGRRATKLIAVSCSARDEVIQHLGRSDVTVTWEGVNSDTFHPAPTNEVEALKKQYGLDRYILCIGTLQRRKNHLRLMQAFERIQDVVPHTLVLAGRDGSGAEDIRSYLQEHPNARIKLLGTISDDILPTLYSGADVLVWVSLWEGFGLPVLEAMSCGVPVITSNVSSMPEIADGAAALVDPEDVESIAQTMRTILSNQTQRDEMIKAGYERAKMFAWEKTAERTLTVYQEAAQAQPQTQIDRRRARSSEAESPRSN
ncbi:MAG: glycosyltransferase family 1 protein [Anaerolineae bacterium]|nr:glycosyltransferase family 4 protein [Anaerolineae bacterium]